MTTMAADQRPVLAVTADQSLVGLVVGGGLGCHRDHGDRST
jgi:hypothetical protein